MDWQRVNLEAVKPERLRSSTLKKINYLKLRAASNLTKTSMATIFEQGLELWLETNWHRIEAKAIEQARLEGTTPEEILNKYV